MYGNSELVTLRELAVEYGVTRKTILRDLELFREEITRDLEAALLQYRSGAGEEHAPRKTRIAAKRKSR